MATCKTLQDEAMKIEAAIVALRKKCRRAASDSGLSDDDKSRAGEAADWLKQAYDELDGAVRALRF